MKISKFVFAAIAIAIPSLAYSMEIEGRAFGINNDGSARTATGEVNGNSGNLNLFRSNTSKYASWDCRVANGKVFARIENDLGVSTSGSTNTVGQIMATGNSAGHRLECKILSR